MTKKIGLGERIFAIFLCSIVMVFLNRDYAPDCGTADGFIAHIKMFRDLSLSDINYELKQVHFIRYIIFYPFVLREYLSFPYFFDIIIILLVINLFVYRKIDVLLYVFPIFVSYRTSLCIVSLYYVWQSTEYKLNFNYKLLLSFLFSILSSGVLFWCMLIFLANKIQKRKNLSPAFILIIGLSLFLLSLSVMSKYYFFTDGKALNSIISLDYISDFINRSNLFYSKSRWGYTKNIFYFTYLFLVLTVIFFKARLVTDKSKKIIILLSLINFLLEGLPAISFIMIYIHLFLEDNYNSNKSKFNA